jgi:hypothetical protein
MLMIGTRKGGFLAVSDPQREQWDLKGPFLKGSEVHYITFLPKTNSLMATVKSWWFGAGVRLSNDRGDTWTEPERDIRFAESRGKSVERVWIVREGPDALYAGVDPGALFRSRDYGRTWDEVTPLTDHPTRDKWSPGAGGLMVHSICPDPVNPKRKAVHGVLCYPSLTDIPLDRYVAGDFPIRTLHGSDLHLLVIESPILAPVDQFPVPDPPGADRAPELSVEGRGVLARF